jgi:predicted nucleic acid-binding protein
MYLIDTNILIYYLNGSIPEKSSDFITKVLSESFRISVITKLEFLGWKGFNSRTFSKASEFLGYAEVIGLNDAIESTAISLRRSISIEFADAVIAATALEIGATLITRNDDDFKNVDKLIVVNPWKETGDDSTEM